MSVMVCIPTEADIRSETVETTFAICANHVGGASFRTYRAHPIDRCRNICVKAFLESQHSHLLFIDSDVVPPSDCLDVMLAAAAPLVCGLYPLQLTGDLCLSVARKLGPDTYGFMHDCPDEPFEVDAAGLGCCLIHREVFDRIGYPWFKFHVRENLSQVGEDIHFFEQCASAGYRPIALPKLLCSHHRTLDLLSAYQQLRTILRRTNSSEAA